MRATEFNHSLLLTTEEYEEPEWRFIVPCHLGDFNSSSFSHRDSFINFSLFLPDQTADARISKQTDEHGPAKRSVNQRPNLQTSLTCLIADVWCHHAFVETQIPTRLISPHTHWMSHKVAIWLEAFWEVSCKVCVSSTRWKLWVVPPPAGVSAVAPAVWKTKVQPVEGNFVKRHLQCIFCSVGQALVLNAGEKSRVLTPAVCRT